MTDPTLPNERAEAGEFSQFQRRDFLKASGAAALASGVSTSTANAIVPTHNFDKYDFGAGPAVVDRLYQGPFSADVFPSWTVAMATTSSTEVVPNYGMGFVTYICDEVGPASKAGEAQQQSIEKLVRMPLGQKLYIRVNWKDVQQKPGRLDLCEHWKTTFALARQYGKRIGLRVALKRHAQLAHHRLRGQVVVLGRGDDAAQAQVI